jgi:hypothetical protein
MDRAAAEAVAIRFVTPEPFVPRAGDYSDLPVLALRQAELQGAD